MYLSIATLAEPSDPPVLRSWPLGHPPQQARGIIMSCQACSQTDYSRLLQFDRWDIPQNKLAAACLDSRLCLYDARTQHPKHGLACLSQRLSPGATLWSARFLPSNRCEHGQGRGGTPGLPCPLGPRLAEANVMRAASAPSGRQQASA